MFAQPDSIGSSQSMSKIQYPQGTQSLVQATSVRKDHMSQSRYSYEALSGRSRANFSPSSSPLIFLTPLGACCASFCSISKSLRTMSSCSGCDGPCCLQDRSCAFADEVKNSVTKAVGRARNEVRVRETLCNGASLINVAPGGRSNCCGTPREAGENNGKDQQVLRWRASHRNLGTYYALFQHMGLIPAFKSFNNFNALTMRPEDQLVDNFILYANAKIGKKGERVRNTLPSLSMGPIFPFSSPVSLSSPSFSQPTLLSLSRISLPFQMRIPHPLNIRRRRHSIVRELGDEETFCEPPPPPPA
ncbi:hypothetical protein KC326_g217 [Hortaea werneckii]|nr:hypothetical protein KC326_g217 [Hortaea werneckii]